MKPILEVCDLTKRFGGLVAVRNVSFSVRRGEIVGILGPNGAGKTTLFNLLTGFMAPDQGSVEFNDKPLQKQPPYRVVNMGLARTFQLCRPFVGMSVLENVMVACYSPRGARHGTTHGESPENRSRKILGDVGLGHKIDMPAESLSYGDQRRLEIARALATEPELLLLDEPFAGLGSSEIEPLSELIRHLHRERGLTILIIEHKLREFMQLVQSVIAIDFGEVIATGSPEDIVRHPKVVEAYIGKTEADLGIA
ncbi:ABC transporter ATP-binding protein [Noviherbaspirillum sp.]|jgi:branched-chain amino acid transport system ATP-binding protein|uniref:ABC transporter ATP-binding protein n=1 Tax=Noviherbaspirillum sp. TaxID=1926288 RepID=UPI0025E035DE|nr:ABC transporter ATP-binding protein [Noviherbaspirillum sp.]